MSAVTRTAITVSVLLVTTMGTNVGASQNIVRRKFILIRADGFATPMETGVIMNTPAGNGIRTGSITTTTTTAADKLGDTPHALGPAGCGAQVPPVMWRVDWLSARLARMPMRLGMRTAPGLINVTCYRF